MSRRLHSVIAAGSLVVLLGGCGSGGSAVDSTATVESTTSSSATVSSSSVVATSGANVWVGPPVDVTKLPIGTSHVSTTGASVGGLYACNSGNPNGGGADVAGPWIDESAGTWNLTKKVAVLGELTWPMASYSEKLSGDRRIITGNALPVGQITGIFPIDPSDPAYAYDRNANSISAHDFTISLPSRPTTAAAPTCLSGGDVGILKNGVPLFASLDERNRDAVAYETQDACGGHPQQVGVYHYHDIPSCIRDAAKGSSSVVGFARDGFPIVVERDAKGNLPTNADLDRCHGRTSTITLDGKQVESYHYSATYEFPYFIGCYAGTPVS